MPLSFRISLLNCNDDDDGSDDNYIDNNNNNNNKQISEDTNVIEKEHEEIIKYEGLTIEIQRMWNVKSKVMPVIIGATGTISKSHRQFLNNKKGKREIKELQKIKPYWDCTHTS